MQDSESEGSTWLCLGCFDLRPRHQIIYNWKPGGPLFPFSALIWKNTILIWSISARKCDVRGSPLAYHISSCIVCISSKISSNKWYTTINFIRNWTFNLFLPNVCSSGANMYNLMARPSFYETLRFDFPWRSDFNYIVPVFCLHVQFLILTFLWITSQIFHLSSIIMECQKKLFNQPN